MDTRVTMVTIVSAIRAKGHEALVSLLIGKYGLSIYGISLLHVTLLYIDIVNKLRLQHIAQALNVK